MLTFHQTTVFHVKEAGEEAVFYWQKGGDHVHWGRGSVEDVHSLPDDSTPSLCTLILDMVVGLRTDKGNQAEDDGEEVDSATEAIALQ